MALPAGLTELGDETARAVVESPENSVHGSGVASMQAPGNHVAQPADRTSACSSTVCVADSCLSGG